MSSNDIYNDHDPFNVTIVPSHVTAKQIKTFKKEVRFHPTHPHKRWVVRSGTTGRIKQIL